MKTFVYSCAAISWSMVLVQLGLLLAVPNPFNAVMLLITLCAAAVGTANAMMVSE